MTICLLVTFGLSIFVGEDGPHAFRNKRVPTRPVELLKHKCGGERVPHRLPTVLLTSGAFVSM